jgi:hypothetical protein
VITAALAAKNLRAQLDANGTSGVTIDRGGHMDGNGKVRMLAIGVALAGSALLQGCAVVTAPYVAERSPTTSHSMVSRFDKRFYSADGTAPSGGGSSLYMPRTRESGMFFFRY